MDEMRFKKTFSFLSLHILWAMALALGLLIQDSSAATATGDTVTITNLGYSVKNQTLLVIATSSQQPTVTLSADGFGDLRWNSSLSRYQKTFTGVTTKPEKVTISSTGKGSDVESVPYPARADLPEASHAGRFSNFQGTATCLRCHTSQAMEVHGSVHYQWKGDASESVGLSTAEAGKLGGINDFCIYPDINWIGKLTNLDGLPVDGGCARCHVGLGNKPAPAATDAQLKNIDCLVCHSDNYKRKVELVNGSYRFVPDTSKMSVTLYEAAVSVARPSKDSCLNCHTKAGGGNNFKRGDIEEAHRNPAKDFDVHMSSKSSGGAGLSCLDCHTAKHHRIAGRGTDLRERDLFEEVSCTKCHSDQPHGKQDIDKHTARVNCTVCHIPTFAKVATTDMERDWSKPGEVDPATRLYEPHMVKMSNVIPEYAFFNGLSYFYEFGQQAKARENGRVLMSAPLGDVMDPDAKIFAFKYHLGKQPIDPLTGELLPLKIGRFFMTGNLASAVKLGVTEVGWDYNGYKFVDTDRYMGLFHEVAPKENAVSCTDCHGSSGRMNFENLGYTPNEMYNGKPLCASCHKDKSAAWPVSELFTKVHRKHVNDKQLDCSKCHPFTSANGSK
jgi:hypothetical protein